MKKWFFFFMVCVLGATNSYGSYCATAKRGAKSSATIARYMRDLAANSSGFAVVGSLGKTDTVAVGEGQDIDAILITENASWETDSGKPTVVITGAIHGNEWATPDVCLGIAEYLLENKDNDAPAVDDKGELINNPLLKPVGGDLGPLSPRINNIKELLQTIQVVIIPVYNPDGYDYSQSLDGRKSYYGAGWRPNRCNLKAIYPEEVCYQADGTVFDTPPTDREHCFLADYDDRDSGGDLEEESIIVCETVDRQNLYIFEQSLDVATAEMFDAIYDSKDPQRVVCASGDRRIWKDAWSDVNDDETISVAQAKKEGYLQDAYGTDINRNFKFQWDVVKDQKHLFIRTRSSSSRMFRGVGKISEEEATAMEKLIEQRHVVALIDYHSGSTQVLYPYAYSTQVKVDKGIFKKAGGLNDYQVFRAVSEKIAAILNAHDRGDPSIQNFTAAQNYNGKSVGSGVARDCYYGHEEIAAINIEVHDKKYTYKMAEFPQVVPKICKTNVPGAIWFLFWAAGLGG